LDVFLFVGAGFEPWAEKMEEELEKKGVEVLEMAKIIEFRHIEDDEEAKDEEDEHGEEGLDAHFWLDPVLAKIALEAITDTFAKLDAENRENYLRNAQEYLAKLADLDQNYRQGLAQCRLREIIVAHDAFSYVGARYNITIHAIAGLSPHEEPTPRRMAELATLAREKGISYVFFETLTSPRLAETIAREVGAQTLVLNPIEGLTAKEQAEGKNYLALMEENLQALKLALSCE
jgi:zinc transport system substrate-binding protein